jgi:hypothetical protein
VQLPFFWRYMDFRAGGRASENDGFIAVKKDAVLDVPADGPGENDFLEVAAFAD